MLQRKSLRAYEHRIVIVHVASGPSIRGLLVAAHRDCFVVGRAEHLDTEEALKGEVVIPRGPGVWLQVTGA